MSQRFFTIVKNGATFEAAGKDRTKMRCIKATLPSLNPNAFLSGGFSEDSIAAYIMEQSSWERERFDEAWSDSNQTQTEPQGFAGTAVSLLKGKHGFLAAAGLLTAAVVGAAVYQLGGTRSSRGLVGPQLLNLTNGERSVVLLHGPDPYHQQELCSAALHGSCANGVSQHHFSPTKKPQKKVFLNTTTLGMQKVKPHFIANIIGFIMCHSGR